MLINIPFFYEIGRDAVRCLHCKGVCLSFNLAFFPHYSALYLVNGFFFFVSHFLNSFLYSIIMYNLYLTESDIVINYNFNVLTYGCSHLYICLLNALYMKPFRCCCLIIGRQQGLVTFFIDISTYSSWQGLTYNWVSIACMKHWSLIDIVI